MDVRVCILVHSSSCASDILLKKKKVASIGSWK